jgi:spoIIIJ-associated protein
MDKYKEYEAKSIKKAVKSAGQELDIPESEIKYDILSYGSSGIFGLVGFKKAKIRVYLPKDEVDTSDENVISAEEEEPHDSRAVVEPDNTPAPPKDVEPDTGDNEGAEDVDDTELERSGLQVLQKILDSITDGTEVKSKIQRGEIRFDVSGGETGILIGKKGQTLEAIQYLIEKMVRKLNNKRLRIKVDVEGYLLGREESLVKQAKNLALKVNKTGKPITVGQMNPHDRRIVHVALKGIPGVITQSRGDGYIRKILILPKRNSRKKQNHKNSSSTQRQKSN